MKCPHCGKKIKVDRPLLPRERAFAAHWVSNNGNGREAARAAGYTGNNPSLDSQASRLLRRLKVKELIELSKVPMTEFVRQIIREVGLAGDEPGARIAAARLAARIEGMIAPTKHQHAHLHAHLELPAAGTPEAAEHALRSVRALARLLTPSQRSLLLRDLAGPCEVPVLPEVHLVQHDVAGEGEGEGRGVRSGGGSEGPSPRRQGDALGEGRRHAPDHLELGERHHVPHRPATLRAGGGPC